MANVNYDPNARYDCGPNAAGCGRVSLQATLNSTTTPSGIEPDSIVSRTNIRVGPNAAGVPRVDTSSTVTTSYNNAGPNAAGNNRSFNDI